MAFNLQNEPRPPAPNQMVDIESLQSSINHLVDNWHRRQRFSNILPIFSCLIKTKHKDSSYQNAMKSRFQTKLASILNSTPVHIITILLILLDLSLTGIDLSSTFLSCDDPTPGRKEKYKMYHWAEVAILCLLSAKVAALVIALGYDFFISLGHVIDGVVMVGALVLEVMAEGKGAGLLVVVSLWRVVRVIESAFELSNEEIEGRIEEVVVEFEVLKEENKRLERIVVEKELRIMELEQILAMETNVTFQV